MSLTSIIGSMAAGPHRDRTAAVEEPDAVEAARYEVAGGSAIRAHGQPARAGFRILFKPVNRRVLVDLHLLSWGAGALSV